jgi:hypothetical protein
VVDPKFLELLKPHRSGALKKESPQKEVPQKEAPQKDAPGFIFR